MKDYINNIIDSHQRDIDKFGKGVWGTLATISGIVTVLLFPEAVRYAFMGIGALTIVLVLWVGFTYIGLRVYEFFDEYGEDIR